MLYLIDANVIIKAKDNYYEVHRVPEFWEWLVHHGEAGNVKVPLEIWDEVNSGPDNDDPFYKWRRDRSIKEALVLEEDIDVALMQHVLASGYGADLTDDELEYIGKDPFLVAYALNGQQRCAVTEEQSRPSAQRKKRKIPDVCNDLGITPLDTFALIRKLNFSTSWKS